MEEAKKDRSGKGGTVTRRINELLGALEYNTSPIVLKEKIQKAKDAIENLGTAQDTYVNLIKEGDTETFTAAENWYYEYDDRGNNVIKKATEQIESQMIMKEVKPDPNIKIQKLKLPKFERYINHMDDETKYDYLFLHTEGKAHEYVSNKSVYSEAMGMLDDKFGNKHVILKLLLDDVRCLPVVTRGNFNAFENLSFKVCHFREID